MVEKLAELYIFSVLLSYNRKDLIISSDFSLHEHLLFIFQCCLNIVYQELKKFGQNNHTCIIFIFNFNIFFNNRLFRRLFSIYNIFQNIYCVFLKPSLYCLIPTIKYKPDKEVIMHSMQ